MLPDVTQPKLQLSNPTIVLTDPLENECHAGAHRKPVDASGGGRTRPMVGL